MVRGLAIAGLLVGSAACSSPAVVAGDAGDAGVDVEMEASTDTGSEAADDADAGPLIVAFAGYQTYPTGIALDSTTVYWASDWGTIKSCPKIDCQTPTVIWGAAERAWNVAVNATNIYWTQYSSNDVTGAIMTCPLSGCGNGPTTVVGPVPGEPIQIAIDANNVYWSQETIVNGQIALGEASVMSCPLAGCATPTVLATNQAPQNWGNSGLAVDATSVYWGNIYDENIVSCAIGGCGGAPTAIVSGQLVANSVVVDGNEIYWTTAGVVDGAGKIMKCDRTDCLGTLTQLAEARQHPLSLVKDATNLYWLEVQSDQSKPSALVTCPIAGCNDTPSVMASIAPSFNQPFGLAIDSTSLYWTDHAQGGLVMELTPK